MIPDTTITELQKRSARTEEMWKGYNQKLDEAFRNVPQQCIPRRPDFQAYPKPSVRISRHEARPLWKRSLAGAFLGAVVLIIVAANGAITMPPTAVILGGIGGTVLPLLVDQPRLKLT